MSRKRKAAANIDIPMQDHLRVYHAGLYGRLSVLDNGKVDGDSLESQIDLMERYVAERPYLRYVKLYQDNGFTGTNFRRPGWDRLMQDVLSGEIDCIIVKDLSRLGRNYIETGTFLEKECPRLGLRFISINDGYDSASTDANVVLTAALKNIVNDFYAKDISRKVCTSLAIKRELGEYIGHYAPYGYQKDPQNKNHLVVDPVTAPTVLQIYQWRAGKMSYGAIMRRLNESDIPSPGRYRFENGIITNNNKQGSALLWNRHVLKDILQNPVYLGNLQQGKRRMCLYRGIPEHNVPADEWSVSYGTHESIIPEDLFRKVQDYNEQQRSAYRSNYGRHADLPKAENPYRSILVCPDCGKQLKMHRSLANDGSRAYYAYVCPTFLEHREKGCSRKFIRAADLDQIVLETLKLHMALFLDTTEVLRGLLRKDLQSLQRRVSADTCEALKKQIARKSSLSAALYSDWKEGILTSEEYSYARKAYAQELEELKRRLQEESAKGNRLEEKVSMADTWKKKIDDYQNCSIVTREMVNALIHSMTVDSDGNVSICFHFDGVRESLAKEIELLQGAA